jgi:hypothetical protein
VPESFRVDYRSVRVCAGWDDFFAFHDDWLRNRRRKILTGLARL